MIRRPNVRSRCLQPNIQARHAGNRKFDPRSFKIYWKSCRWCRRPKTEWFTNYPGLCGGCARFLLNWEAQPSRAEL